MLNQHLVGGAAAACLWLTVLPVAAQPPRDANQGAAQEERGPATEERPAVEVNQEQASLERELERARAQMESAAREVARLSGGLAGPIVNDVTRRFRYAGQRAMLGLNIEDAELGARVVAVSSNGPAATAGLAVGDTIVAIEGAELVEARRGGGGQQSPSELLLAQMSNVDPGENVELRVLRDGDYRNVQVQAREFEPQQFFEQHAPDFSSWTGMFTRVPPWADMQLAALTPALGAYFGTDHGLLVVRAPTNPALALQDGDVILDIGGREPVSPEHAARILASFEPGGALRVTIMRRQQRETLEVEIPVEPTR